VHPGSRRWLVALLAGLTLLTACRTPTSPAFENYLDLGPAGFRLPVPDGWGAAPAALAEVGGRRLVAYLSNQDLQVDCADPADQSTCLAPVPHLADGALLALWTTANCAGPACELPAGDRLPVGGREATRQLGTSICGSIGATREIAYVVQVSLQRLDTILSCDRNAPASVRQTLLDALAAVDWRTP